jgi:hypothetical protein
MKKHWVKLSAAVLLSTYILSACSSSSSDGSDTGGSDSSVTDTSTDPTTDTTTDSTTDTTTNSGTDSTTTAPDSSTGSDNSADYTKDGEYKPVDQMSQEEIKSELESMMKDGLEGNNK